MCSSDLAVVNGTDAVATGFELEVAGALTNSWTYNFGINYSKSVWDKDGFVGSSPILKGAQLPGVPKEMGNVLDGLLLARQHGRRLCSPQCFLSW